MQGERLESIFIDPFNLHLVLCLGDHGLYLQVVAFRRYYYGRHIDHVDTSIT